MKFQNKKIQSAYNKFEICIGTYDKYILQYLSHDYQVHKNTSRPGKNMLIITI